MSSIEIKVENNQMLVSSREVADNFGKDHRHVLDSVRNLVAENSAAKLLFFESSFDNRGKQYPMYLMNRDGFSLLVMGFTGKKALEWKLRYIEAFNSMEKQIQQSYRLPETPEEKIDLLLHASSSTSKKLEKVEERVSNLEENRFLNPNEYGYLNTQVAARIREVKNIHQMNLNRQQNSELFRAIGREIKQISGVRCRSQIRYKDFDKIVDFVNTWEPSRATMVIIGQMSMNV